MTANEVKEKLGAEHVSKKANVFTVRRSYFYRLSKSAEGLVNRVKSVFPNAVIVDSGDVWKPFRGGASVAKQSHWYVKFTLPS